jgi:hypothetical protein
MLCCVVVVCSGFVAIPLGVAMRFIPVKEAPGECIKIPTKTPS